MSALRSPSVPDGLATPADASPVAEQPIGDRGPALRDVGADEQAALRRLAALVARGAGRDPVLTAIVAEASSLFPVHFAALLSYEAGGAASIVALSSGPPGLAIGERAPDVPDGLVLQVYRSRRPTRVDAYAELPGTGVARMSELGITAGAAAPIVVDGRLWGVLAAMVHSGPVAPGLEYRVADFADLAATAVASAQAKDESRALAEEQQALRRIAELAVRGAGPDEVLHAVVREASTLLNGAAMTLAQFDTAGSATVRATSGDQPSAGWQTDAAGDNLMARVRRTVRPGRVDQDQAAPGSLAPDQGRADSVRSAVVVPISIEGRVWGMLAATSPVDSLPADTEWRLSQFADIAAAATAGAMATASLRRLADEQAALRVVAETAARDAPTHEVLHAVAVQASKLADVDFTTVLRYDADGSTEIVALSGGPDSLSIGLRAPGSGTGAIQRVWRTHRSARVADVASVTGRWPELVFGFGYTTTAAVPILIHGELWGTLVALGRGEPLSEVVEDGLARFADLAGTAISGAQARQQVRALADEQAAFRRVAELVAHGAALDEVFSAVTTEACNLMGGVPATLQRIDPEKSTGAIAAGVVDPRPVRGVTGEVAVPVVVEGRLWGKLTTRSDSPGLPPGTEERLEQFAELAAVAIANAENRSQLKASRARVVATADESRRRLQRDVHDGAQQRLVQTIITLKLARDAIAGGGTGGDRVVEALYHAERANRELRDLLRGILPAALTQGGLRTGLESLISDISIAVRLKLTAPPLAPQTETTAYFIVAEALTNVVKHARATHADVTVDLEGETLTIEVSDDGVGGATPGTDGGLAGLSDRVGAADGTLTIISPAGHGTALRATFPVTTRRR